jgi:F-type H+-transporting ATPase subunit b
MKGKLRRSARVRARALRGLLLTAVALGAPALALANEEAHGGHAEHGWDQTAITASVLNFVILLLLFVYLFRDKLNAFLKERKATVERELNEAARLKAEAEAKHKLYTERLAKLDQELEQIKQDMIAAGVKERDRIVAEAEQKAARLRREAEFIVEQQVKQLRAEITREAADAAIAAAEQLLTKATTSFDQQRLAQEYLTSLQATHGVKPSLVPPSPQSENRV